MAQAPRTQGKPKEIGSRVFFYRIPEPNKAESADTMLPTDLISKYQYIHCY